MVRFNGSVVSGTVLGRVEEFEPRQLPTTRGIYIELARFHFVPLDYALSLLFQCTNNSFQSLDGRPVVLRTQLSQSGHSLSSLHALALREFHLL